MSDDFADTKKIVAEARRLVELDPLILEYAKRMNFELDANTHKKGDWHNLLGAGPAMALELYGDIPSHLEKLQHAIDAGDHAAIAEYSADVSNLAMMVTLALNVAYSPEQVPSLQMLNAISQYQELGNRLPTTLPTSPTPAAPSSTPLNVYISFGLAIIILLLFLVLTTFGWPFVRP